MIRWVAKLVCDHVVGGLTSAAPLVSQQVWCHKCQDVCEVVDVVSDVPERGPNDHPW